MEKMRALYVTGAKGSGQAAYEKYANKVYDELQAMEGLEISEVAVKTPISFPFSQHALDYGLLPLKVRLSHSNDLVHAAHQGLAHVLLPQKRRKVVTCLDVIPFAFKEEYANNWLKKRLLWLTAKGIKSADAVVTISDFSKLEIQKYLGIHADKISIAYPAVDHSVFKPSESKNATRNKQKTVLYVGSEQPRKNLGVLLEAFALAKKQIPNMRLLKVGKPQWKTGRQDFIFKAQELGVAKDIEIIDSVAGEGKLAQIYRSADVFVFPSLYEGFGLPPLEAMACATPVVCSNSSSLPEVVGDAALSVEPNNAKQFANGIVKILSDEKYASQLRSKGLKQAKKFSWKQAAQKVFEAYQRVW